jgi:hypothetical protein
MSSPTIGSRTHLSTNVRDGGTDTVDPTSAELALAASSAAQRTRPPSIRDCLRSSARPGRQPQAKRQAGIIEGQNFSAANEGPEPITPPLPLQDARAVAPNDAGARFHVLDGSNDELVELSDRVGTATRTHLADNAHALEQSPVLVAAESEAMDVPRQGRKLVISSGNWSYSGRKMSEAIEDVGEIEMVDFAAPAKTVETEGGDGWILVFGADDCEEYLKPTEALFRMFRTYNKECCRGN